MTNVVADSAVECLARSRATVAETAAVIVVHPLAEWPVQCGTDPCSIWDATPAAKKDVTKVAKTAAMMAVPMDFWVHDWEREFAVDFSAQDCLVAPDAEPRVAMIRVAKADVMRAVAMATR